VCAKRGTQRQTDEVRDKLVMWPFELPADSRDGPHWFPIGSTIRLPSCVYDATP
jgi:hypothetical protein